MKKMKWFLKVLKVSRKEKGVRKGLNICELAS